MNHNFYDWSGVVGLSGEEAKAAILKDNSNLNVIILPEGTPVTRDYRWNRVRIFVDDNGKVVSAPRIA